MKIGTIGSKREPAKFYKVVIKEWPDRVELQFHEFDDDVYEATIIRKDWIDYIDEVSNKLWMQAASGITEFQMTRNQVDKLLNLVKV
jgi:hypothetical protein